MQRLDVNSTSKWQKECSLNTDYSSLFCFYWKLLPLSWVFRLRYMYVWARFLPFFKTTKNKIVKVCVKTVDLSGDAKYLWIYCSLSNCCWRLLNSKLRFIWIIFVVYCIHITAYSPKISQIRISLKLKPRKRSKAKQQQQTNPSIRMHNQLKVINCKHLYCLDAENGI